MPMFDKKYPRLILLLLIILLLVIGYRYWQGHNQPQNTPNQTEQTITVIDNQGRKVQVPAMLNGLHAFMPFPGM